MSSFSCELRLWTSIPQVKSYQIKTLPNPHTPMPQETIIAKLYSVSQAVATNYCEFQGAFLPSMVENCLIGHEFIQWINQIRGW